MAEGEDSLPRCAGIGAGLQDDHTTAEPWLAGFSLVHEAGEAEPLPARWIWKSRNEKALMGSERRAERHRGARRRPVLIVGDGVLGDRIAAELERHPSYRLVGHVQRQCMLDAPDLLGQPDELCDPLDRLDEIALRDGVEYIVVAMTDRRHDLPMDQLLACRFRGMRVEDAVAFYERLSRKIPLDGLTPGYFVFRDGFHWPSRAVKRATDILLALITLLCTAPLFVLLPALIKLTSPGPVFYRQERVGLDGRRFTILKFRSMRQDAEAGRPLWAQEQDPRVTTIGRIMRQYRLDELPQIINVLWGEMSMIGPRPERPEFIERLSKEVPFYAYRLAVKPGITGWAQVKFRYGATVQDAAEKLQYDLYYIKHMSLRLDALIACKTIATVLFQSGAR
ncbi:TIGR03013 family XrtA/PEP-CTERM system glycosyltransferase [Candidatus Nitrospira bockiana]